MAGPALIASRRYDIRLLGIERMHPFDSIRSSRALAVLERELGAALEPLLIAPERPVRDEELERVHDRAYLRRLRGRKAIAEALEMRSLALLPSWLLRWRVMTPMRYAVRGTVVAAEAAMAGGLGLHIGGGYHHAKPDRGEGFCVYADAALAIDQLRASGALASDAPVAYVDTDAHLGNGVAHMVLDDPTVRLFDIFNGSIYPTDDRVAMERVDRKLPLEPGTRGEVYLVQLERELPAFLDELSPALLIHNAGTDVFAGDPLGGLSLNAAAVLTRDRLVARLARERGIPLVMLTSGGYTDDSHRLIAASYAAILGDYGLLPRT